MKGGGGGGLVLALLLPVPAGLPGLLAQEAPPPLPPNPFAGVETIIFENGLKTWYKRLPNTHSVSISVALPFGRDSDPPGKEQLAHFTEHMRFADYQGVAEEEIKRRIEALGGEFNAQVSDDRTFFFVRIGSEHSLYALDWLYRVLSPHPIDQEAVSRQREPVALEIRARPRQLLDWVLAYYVVPPALRPRDFWQREFGLRTIAMRDYYPYASLNRITPEDLRGFYDTYYVPSAMTLAVVGDVDRESTLAKIEETFATLPPRADPWDSGMLRDPNRYRQSIFWDYRSNVFYRSRFKLYGLSDADNVMLIVTANLLRKRLNDQLRFSEDKATYSLRSRVVRRGAAAYLEISGGLAKERFALARQIIEAEIEALRTGSLPEAEFAADRDAVARQLRAASYSPRALENWVRIAFYNRHVNRDFPDLVAVMDTVSQARIKDFASAALAPERQVVTLIYPHPIRQGALVVVVAGLSWFSVLLARLLLLRSIDMTRIRYVARFRIPFPLLVLTGGSLFVIAAIGGRLLFYAYQELGLELLSRFDSFTLQWSAYASMLMLTLFLGIMLLSLMPRKILVFDDRVLIKYLSYRSVEIPAGEIVETGLRRFSTVWLSKSILRCLPLAFGLASPAVYLRRGNGRSYFFDVRKRDELVALLAELSQAPLSSPKSPSPTRP